jgi:hypothetical protein
MDGSETTAGLDAATRGIVATAAQLAECATGLGPAGAAGWGAARDAAGCKPGRRSGPAA